MNKFNKLFKQMVSEDVGSRQTYALLSGRVVFLVGSRMEDCPFEGGPVTLVGIEKKGQNVYDVHCATLIDDEDQHGEQEGYTHTVDQSTPGAVKDETGNNLNVKVVAIRS